MYRHFISAAGGSDRVPAAVFGERRRKKRSMVFRKGRREEAEKILKLYQSVIGSEFCTWNEFYPGREEINADMSCGNLYVLTEEKNPGDGGAYGEDRIVGAASIVSENELDDLEFWSRPETAGDREEKVCEIARIVVAPEYQGKGLAKKLLISLEEILRERGCSAVRLLVAVKNKPACRAYLHCGFRILGECDRYDDHYYVCEKIL